MMKNGIIFNEAMRGKIAHSKFILEGVILMKDAISLVAGLRKGELKPEALSMTYPFDDSSAILAQLNLINSKTEKRHELSARISVVDKTLHLKVGRDNIAIVTLVDDTVTISLSDAVAFATTVLSGESVPTEVSLSYSNGQFWVVVDGEQVDSEKLPCIFRESTSRQVEGGKTETKSRLVIEQTVRDEEVRLTISTLTLKNGDEDDGDQTSAKIQTGYDIELSVDGDDISLSGLVNSEYTLGGSLLDQAMATLTARQLMRRRMSEVFEP